MLLLIHSHLAVIRAALKYWDEEMSPHDPGIYKGYFEEPIGTGEWIPPTIAFRRSQFSACEVRYALCSPDQSALFSSQLFQAIDDFIPADQTPIEERFEAARHLTVHLSSIRRRHGFVWPFPKRKSDVKSRTIPQRS